MIALGTNIHSIKFQSGTVFSVFWKHHVLTSSSHLEIIHTVRINQFLLSILSDTYVLRLYSNVKRLQTETRQNTLGTPVARLLDHAVTTLLFIFRVPID